MRKNSGAFYALLAAVLFGASTPASKVLLRTIDPLMLAGLLYLGAGIGLCAVMLFRRRSSEAPLRGYDWWWLAGSTLAGGIIGPVLLMVGLAHTSAASASLLLNLESVFTALLAWVAFREHASRRTVSGMILILVGGVALAWPTAADTSQLLGAVFVAGACLAWALDNNLTRQISGTDPINIASLKTVVAGSVTTALALLFAHARWPDARTVVTAGGVGFFGYGVSLALFVFALRHIGTARTSAYFSTAPFIGAAIAFAAGSGSADLRFFIATALMITGILLHLTERHAHLHTHEPIVHEHAHVHDEHHRHEHAPGDQPGAHSHLHAHERLTHSHEHFPDIQHRHAH